MTRPMPRFGVPAIAASALGLATTIATAGIGSAEPWAQFPIWSGTTVVSGLVVVDIDNDGDSDLVSCRSDGLYWHENIDGLHSPWPSHVVSQAGCVRVEAGKIDQNNTVDLVVVEDTQLTPLNIYFNDSGSATSWTYLNLIDILSYGPQPRIADFDKNGLRDIVTPRILFLQQPGEEFLKVPLPGELFFATPARINADNRVDLFGGFASSSQSLSWTENVDGTGTNWELHPVLDSPDLVNPQEPIAVDLDEDGDSDALIHAGCKLVGMINPGSSGDWSITPYIEVNEIDCLFGGGVSSADVADQNGDGRLDIVVARTTTPAVVQLMLGKDPSGEFRQPTSVSSDLGNQTSIVRFAELDGVPPLEIVVTTIKPFPPKVGTIQVLHDAGTGFCGDAVLNEGESCDDGDFEYSNGDGCSAECVAMPCGKPVTGLDGKPPRSSDALWALRSAIGTLQCALSVCDSNGDGNLSAADALRILRKSVGLTVTLICPQFEA